MAEHPVVPEFFRLVSEAVAAEETPTPSPQPCLLAKPVKAYSSAKRGTRKLAVS
jgi:hypothetical protein